jgi:two-component system, response regulator YesN
MYKAVIIDDEPWTREVIKSLGQWKELGIEVIGEASDGEYGRELIAHLTPDIILTDVRMPHLNGIDLVTILRREGCTAKVIVISGYDDFDYVHSVIKLDVIDYLLKPVKPEELNEQLARAVEQLQKEKLSRSGESMDGFLNAPWTSEYFALRNHACESLRANNSEDILLAFEKMKTLLSGTRIPEISKGMMIGLYYGLMEKLQKYISESGYTKDDLFTGDQTSFVFSGETRVTDMLDNMSALYSHAAGTVSKLIHERNRLDIRQVESYVKNRFSETGGVTLEETAARFYVSKEYLSKIFKLSVGEGFSDYVASLRMAKAKELILRGVALKDVGSMTGYLDQAHFYKSFKRFYGITPGEMQKSLKKDSKT